MSDGNIIKTINSVERDYKNKHKYIVKFDSEEDIFLNEEIVFLNNIKPGSKFSLFELEKIIDDDDYILCKNYAFNLTGRFSKTKKQLEDKLISRGHNAKNIKKVLDLLQEYSLVNDEIYAKNYIISKLSKEGKEKISFELSLKGIPKDIIENKFMELKEEDEEIFHNSLMSAAKKKYTELVLRENDNRKIKEKLYSYLARKGFKWDEIKSCVNNILNGE